MRGKRLAAVSSSTASTWLRLAKRVCAGLVDWRQWLTRWPAAGRHGRGSTIFAFRGEERERSKSIHASYPSITWDLTPGSCPLCKRRSSSPLALISALDISTSGAGTALRRTLIAGIRGMDRAEC